MRPSREGATFPSRPDREAAIVTKALGCSTCREHIVASTDMRKTFCSWCGTWSNAAGTDGSAATLTRLRLAEAADRATDILLGARAGICALDCEDMTAVTSALVALEVLRARLERTTA